MLTEIERELQQRMIRLETRMVQLGDYVGANLRTKLRIEVCRVGTGVVLNIDSLDVSLSRIRTQLAQTQWENKPPVGEIHVYHNHVLVMSLPPLFS